MRIILAFNRYRAPGGEDSVFAAERRMLEEAGHEVIPFLADNRDLDQGSPLRHAANSLWNREAARTMAQLVRDSRADILHVHNSFAILSPAILRAGRAAGAATVLTLHNYRLLCVNGLLLRDGHPCEACVDHALAWRGILHGCYHQGRKLGGLIAATSALHRAAGTWGHHVDRFIALTNFAQALFLRAGFPPERLVVKPNFTALPAKLPAAPPREGFLYVGRWVAEKGLATLAQAWGLLDPPPPLTLLGDGPKSPPTGPTIRPLRGHHPPDKVAAAMARAQALVAPSLCYESFGMVVVEAFAAGLPVIASRLGALAELVREGETGLLFTPGDPQDLAAKIRWAEAHPDAMARMGEKARQVYGDHYTAAANLPQLEAVYAQALSSRWPQGRVSPDAD